MYPPVVAAAAGRSSISPQIAVNRREPHTPGWPRARDKTGSGTLRPTPVPYVLLPIQKVEG
jgi:hypothetical protein